MHEFHTEIPVCKDCHYKHITGVIARRNINEKTECKWCGETLSDRAWFVEEQDDPGLTNWQIKRDELVDYIHGKNTLNNIRTYSKSIDFTVGDIDVWPERTNEKQLNVVRPSSITLQRTTGETEIKEAVEEDVISKATAEKLKQKDESLFDEIKIHLPPTEESRKKSLVEVLELPNGIGVFFGSTGLGGMPAPEGVITPHIIDEDNTSKIDVDSMKTLIDSIITAYSDVYNDGENVLLSKP